jgi:hypothetical protein
MRNVLFFVLSILLHNGLFAQAPHEGVVKLNSQDVVSGVVDINSFINSAVVTMEDGRQLTYHASMIASIETVDECDFSREYRCYDYRSNSFFDRMEKKLFQVIADGEIVLLRRVFEYDVFDASDEYTIEEFYFLDKDNKVKRLRNFKRQILPIMEDYEAEVEVFRQRNGLNNLHKEINMYLIISYYNRLKSNNADAWTMNDLPN